MVEWCQAGTQASQEAGTQTSSLLLVASKQQQLPCHAAASENLQQLLSLQQQNIF